MYTKWDSIHYRDNSFTTTLNSNANPQKLCVRITDEYNQVGEGCSEGYLVDGTNPSISITNTNTTENSISVTVSGSDTHSGIAQYRFSSDNGSNYIDVDTSDSSYTYTFNNLEAGTSYNIAVQVVDEAGNVNTATQVIETEKNLVRDTLLANYTTRLTRTNFRTTVTNTTTGTIYYADTSKGRTYYFAGNPTDNWVRWAGFYWQIIRINEDGTIRMIYQGTEANTTGTDTQIGTSAFNTNHNDKAYVGYMYQSNQPHGLVEDSNIKKILDEWYQNNLARHADDLDGNAGFCGDRTPSTSSSTSNGSGGTGTTQTYYGGYVRLYGNSSGVPTFECENESDLYTTSGSEDGNGALTYPIGLISMDEAWYAGGYASSNSSYYLYTGQNYWTMSPSVYGSSAGVFYVDLSGTLNGYNNVLNTVGVRPVINLRADVTLSGSGTSTDPYVVSWCKLNM